LNQWWNKGFTLDERNWRRQDQQSVVDGLKRCLLYCESSWRHKELAGDKILHGRDGFGFIFS
jgi:hypothetical protein